MGETTAMTDNCHDLPENIGWTWLTTGQPLGRITVDRVKYSLEW